MSSSILLYRPEPMLLHPYTAQTSQQSEDSPNRPIHIWQLEDSNGTRLPWVQFRPLLAHLPDQCKTEDLFHLQYRTHPA